MISDIQAAIAQLAGVNELKAALGRTLTVEQQMEVSKRMHADPRELLRWIETDAGRVAARAFIDAWVAPAMLPPG